MLVTQNRSPLFVPKRVRLSPVKTNVLTRCFASLTATFKRCFRSAWRRKKPIKRGTGLRARRAMKKGKPMVMHQELIAKAAGKHRINPNLLEAIISVESGFSTDAVRYESHWKYFFKVDEHRRLLNISCSTEERLQMFSWGLMQVMGSVAREHSFAGPLQKLCRPDIGLQYGCLHFAKYMKRYGDIREALAAYNGGPGAVKKDGTISNPEYVEKVMKRFLSGKVS